MKRTIERERLISADYVSSILEYRDGLLYWRHRPKDFFKSSRSWRHFNNLFSGKVAGSVANTGYVAVGIIFNGKTRLYMAHRVVWLIHHGQWPDGEIDHINRIRDDNRIENLRLASRSQNCQNKHVDVTRPASGFYGVRKVRENRFRVVMKKYQKPIHIGYFSDPVEAAIAYDNAAIEAFGELANTNEKMGLLP